MATRSLFLAGTIFVLAFGCARSAPQPSVPVRKTATLKPIKKVEIATAWENPAPAQQAPTPAVTPQGGVALTPSTTYLERFDPSGWSGLSTPKAIGGGPPAEDEKPKELSTEPQTEEQTEQQK